MSRIESRDSWTNISDVGLDVCYEFESDCWVYIHCFNSSNLAAGLNGDFEAAGISNNSFGFLYMFLQDNGLTFSGDSY